MYKKSLLMITLFIILLLDGVVLVGDSYPFKEEEGEYQLLLSFDKLKMTYTLTRFRVYKVKDDPIHPAALASHFFPVNYPVYNALKNVSAYNYKTNEKLRCEFIENTDELDNLINELLESINLSVTESKKKEAFRDYYNQLESGKPGFFIYLPINQFENNKIEFIFQFDIDLDDYYAFLNQKSIISAEKQFYLYRNTCLVKEFAKAKNVDKVILLAPAGNEIWNAKLNEKDPEDRDCTDSGRIFVSWDMAEEEKSILNEKDPEDRDCTNSGSRIFVSWDMAEEEKSISLKASFGTSCERLHWESIDEQNWQFILVITAIFLTIISQILFARFTNCKRYKETILIIACAAYLIFIIGFYVSIDLGEFALETNITRNVTGAIIVCMMIVASMWYVSRRYIDK